MSMKALERFCLTLVVAVGILSFVARARHIKISSVGTDVRKVISNGYPQEWMVASDLHPGTVVRILQLR